MNVDDFVVRAHELDRADPLASWRELLAPMPDRLVYLDGNSLGRPTVAALDRLSRVGERWSWALVEAWDDWIDLPFTVGDRLGALLGAASGQAVVGDSTSVQLFKVLHAIVHTLDRPTVLVGAGEFPTDRYVASGVADAVDGRVATMAHGAELDAEQFEHALTASGANIVVLSMIDFRTGSRCDVPTLTEIARGRGAVVVWDLSHAAGVVPVELDDWGVDAAVGCTYKYLHGGPGSPAFAYVRSERQRAWRQPIWGWWGQRDQFAMGERYDPDDRIRQYAVGTPPVLQLVLVDEGVALVESAGIASIDAKRAELTGFAIECVDALIPGAVIVTPRDADRRGGHVSVEHAEALRLARAGRDRGVVSDFRPPNRLRLGFAPLSTTYADVVRAVVIYADLLAPGALDAYPSAPGRVT
jgi:kynureninase